MIVPVRDAGRWQVITVLWSTSRVSACVLNWRIVQLRRAWLSVFHIPGCCFSESISGLKRGVPPLPQVP